MVTNATVSQATLDHAVTGKQAAFGVIWRALNPQLVRFLRSRNVVDPDDLASTIWVEVATGLPTFVGDPPAFRRWLFTTAHRRIIDQARARTRQPQISPLKADGTAATSNAFSVAESAEWAIQLLQQLSDDQATAIALRILADLPSADVATIMGTTEGNVRVLTHRGLARLREKLVATDGDATAEINQSNKESEISSNVVTLAAFRSLTPDT